MATIGPKGKPFPISYSPSVVVQNQPFTAFFSNPTDQPTSFTLSGTNVTGLPAGTQTLAAHDSVGYPNCVATAATASILVQETLPEIKNQTYPLQVTVSVPQV